MQTTAAASTPPGQQARLIAVIFVGVGALCLCIGIALAAHDAWFVHKAIHTFGRIVDFDESTGDDGSVTYHPIFVFLDQSGNEHGVHSHSGSNPPGFDVDDTVPVLYSPGQYDGARIDTFFQMWGGETIVGGLGIIFLIVGILLLRYTGARGQSVRRGFGESSHAA